MEHWGEVEEERREQAGWLVGGGRRTEYKKAATTYVVSSRGYHYFPEVKKTDEAPQNYPIIVRVPMAERRVRIVCAISPNANWVSNFVLVDESGAALISERDRDDSQTQN